MDTYRHLYPLVLNYGGRRSLGVELGVGGGFLVGRFLVEKFEGLTL